MGVMIEKAKAKRKRKRKRKRRKKVKDRVLDRDLWGERGRGGCCGGDLEGKEGREMLF